MDRSAGRIAAGLWGAQAQRTASLREAEPLARIGAQDLIEALGPGEEGKLVFARAAGPGIVGLRLREWLQDTPQHEGDTAAPG